MKARFETAAGPDLVVAGRLRILGKSVIHAMPGECWCKKGERVREVAGHEAKPRLRSAIHALK
jgi:hypothetical protein